MSKKYRKKPIEIDALQWTGENHEEIKSFIEYQGFFRDFPDGHKELFIHTLEGDMRAQPGDYILRGLKGEFYPCRKDIFEATYEEC